MNEKMYIGDPVKTAEKQSRLSSALDRLRSYNSNLTDIRGRLFAMHEKAAGPEVGEDSIGDPKAMPSGTIGTMEDLLMEMGRKIDHINATISKLEQTF